MTTTGLTRADIAPLGYEDRLALAEWQSAQAGIGGFIPAAIRRMPLESRLRLAHDEDLCFAWQRREQIRVASSVRYMVEQYGTVEPPVGPAEPFELWDSQHEVLVTIAGEQRVVVLKSRRLGLSWLGLHYALWLSGFSPSTPAARVLILSKNLGDAGKLLARVKRVNERLPPYLRLATIGEDSKTTFAVRDAEITCLPATPGAARQETATFVMLDEFGFVKNGQAPGIWTAIQPTIEGGGQLLVVSTGNGKVGDGAQFAEIWRDASSGASSAVPVFLPWTARPGRDAAWYERERSNYKDDESFQAEYPATPDEALAGTTAISVYPTHFVDAAEKLGLALWNDDLQALVEEGIEWGTDWGDFQTFTVYALPLPGGGAYVVDELVQSQEEPSDAAREIIDHDPAGLRHHDGGKATAVHSYADAAPKGTNRTFVAVLDAKHEERGYRDRIPEEHLTVPFGVYKEGGNDRAGVNTVAFIKRGLKRAHAVLGSGDTLNAHGAIAIHPRCRLLLAQLRNLERDPDTGKVRKPSLDPKKVEQGDHGGDALVALCAKRAAEWTATRSSDEEEGD